jgi:hypothetical protein
MPNWCSNYVTLTASKEQVDELIVELRKSDEIDTPYQICNILHPRPETEEDWYSWNVNNWGTKWDVNVYSYEVLSETTVSISFDSAWSPPIALYEYLVENDWEVSAYYYEPGMAYCGQFVDGCDEYYEYTDMTADEIEEQIPSEINDMFGISENAREWEENDEGEEWDPAAELDKIVNETKMD